MQKVVKSRILTLVATRWGVLLVLFAALWTLTSTLAIIAALTFRRQRSTAQPYQGAAPQSDNARPLCRLADCPLFPLSPHWSPSAVSAAAPALLWTTLSLSPDSSDAFSHWSTASAASSSFSSSSSPSSDCCAGFVDNLVGRSFQSRLCLPVIDVVYTWVNGSDEQLQRELDGYRRQWEMHKAEELARIAPPAVAATLHTIAAVLNDSSAASAPPLGGAGGDGPNGTAATNRTLPDVFSANRFRDNEELRYSLRSVWRFAPWVRRVFIVTNGQVPHWLNLEHPRLSVVSHADIYLNASHLPTFSSPSIESHLHRIPGLADKFLYFNDDVLLGNEVWPDDFIHSDGAQRVFLSWSLPHCHAGCPEVWLGDGYCDVPCNVADCSWDAGDCVNATAAEGRTGAWDAHRMKDPLALRYCVTGCPNAWVGDKVCDRSCKVEECAFDGGDCGVELIQQHLPELRLTPNSTAFDVPYHTTALFVNLSAVLPGRVTEASHDSQEVVRSAIVTQSLQILTLILYDEKDLEAEDGDAVRKRVEDIARQREEVNVGRRERVEELEAADYFIPHRRVEIFLAGEVDGQARNITFTIQRTRIPSPMRDALDEQQRAEQNSTLDTEERAASERVSRDAPGRELLDVDEVNQQAKTSPPPPSPSEASTPTSAAKSTPALASRSTLRHLHSFEHLPLPRHLSTPLIPPTSPSPPSPRSPLPPPSLPAALAFSIAASSRRWSEYHEVVVEGVPLTRSPHGGVKLRLPSSPSLLQQSLVKVPDGGGFELIAKGEPGSARQSYLVASGQVVELYGGWDAEDEEVADRITAIKRKELWMADQRTASEWMRRTVGRMMEKGGERGTARVIWPWELGFEDSDRWEEAWAYMDRKGDGRGGEEEREGIDEVEAASMEVELDLDAVDAVGHSQRTARFTINRWAGGAEEEKRRGEGVSQHPRHFFRTQTVDALDEEVDRQPEVPTPPPAEPVPLFTSADPNSYLNSSTSPFSRLSPLVNPNGRHLLDTYGDSLRHVSSLLTARYGRGQNRKAPAHMPHLIDRHVMEELQSKWPEHYQTTSAHRFRHPADMQVILPHHAPQLPHSAAPLALHAFMAPDSLFSLSVCPLWVR